MRIWLPRLLIHPIIRWGSPIPRLNILRMSRRVHRWLSLIWLSLIWLPLINLLVRLLLTRHKVMLIRVLVLSASLFSLSEYFKFAISS